jgi:hypothetical protein
MCDGGEEGEFGDDFPMVHAQFAVFQQSRELDREAGQELCIAECEEVFAKDARPKVGRAPVWTIVVLLVVLFLLGDIASIEVDDLLITIEEDDGE